MKTATTKNIFLSIVIPVYNEEKILRSQISAIIKKVEVKYFGKYELVIVANGCTDKTETICSELLRRYDNLRILVINKADYGYALRQGMLSAKGKIIVNFDLDYYDINFLLQALALDPFGYDVIIASKNIKLSEDRRGFIRRLISGLYKYVLYYGFGLQVSDTHGIKAWRNDKMFQQLIKETRNNKEIFDTELIIRSQYAGRKLLELPTLVVEMRKSVSSIFRRALRGYWQVIKLWFTLKIKERRYRTSEKGCPLCYQHRIKLKYRIDEYKIAKCINCGLVRIDNQPSQSDVELLYRKKYFENPKYSVGYINYGAIEKSLRFNFRNRARRIASRIGKNNFSVLDAGTSTGLFLSECEKLGAHGEGVEISEEAVVYAKDILGLKVYKNTLEKFSSRKKYDVVTAWDVVEHSADPRKFVGRARSLLNNNGRFFFTTGDVGSICAKLSGSHWHLYNLPDHLYFYSRNTISKMLESEGFRVKSIRYQWNWYELGYIIERLLKKVFGLRNSKLINLLSYNKITEMILLPINLFDIMEVEAVKMGAKKDSEDKELFYEKIASDFEDIMNSYEVTKRIKVIFGRLLGGKLSGETLLDAGCGIGIFSAIAEKRGAKVISLDVGKSLLKEVAKRCKSRKVVGKVTNLPFEDNTFDISMATEVLEHTTNPRKGFDELVRVTKPGGKIIITVPNRIWLGSLFVANLLKIRPYQGLENWLWWGQVRKMAKKNNLKIEKMFGFNAVPMFYTSFNGINDFMDRFGRLLGPLMVNIALYAEKPEKLKPSNN